MHFLIFALNWPKGFDTFVPYIQEFYPTPQVLTQAVLDTVNIIDSKYLVNVQWLLANGYLDARQLQTHLSKIENKKLRKYAQAYLERHDAIATPLKDYNLGALTLEYVGQEDYEKIEKEYSTQKREVYIEQKIKDAKQAVSNCVIS